MHANSTFTGLPTTRSGSFDSRAVSALLIAS